MAAGDLGDGLLSFGGAAGFTFPLLLFAQFSDLKGTVYSNRWEDGRFFRTPYTLIDLKQGPQDGLRLTQGFTLLLVGKLASPPPSKVAFVSKWRLCDGGRSYELGVTDASCLFFTVSGSGRWPEKAKQLMSNRPLRSRISYAIAAVYEPGRSMALYVNGQPSGQTRHELPDSVYDSETPVFLGTRPGNEKSCALDGWIQEVEIIDHALDQKEIHQWAMSRGLTSAPEPKFPVLRLPYDLAELRRETQTWYGKLHCEDDPYGAYRMRPSSSPGLYASADVAWIRWIMDDLELDENQRDSWIQFIQENQNQDTGIYRHETRHCKAHAFCHATGALNMLGGQHAWEARFLSPYRREEKITSWLDQIDWVHAWGASHDIWGAGVPLMASPNTPSSWKERIFNWLDKEVDPNTGFWRKGTPPRSALEGLGGAFHIWPLYGMQGKPLPYEDRLIESILQLQRQDGSFDGGFGYGNMDGVWALGYVLDRSGPASKAVTQALQRNLEGLMGLHNNQPSAFFSDAHGTLSRIATLAVLQEALPRSFKPGTVWRNPWHQEQLFVLRWE